MPRTLNDQTLTQILTEVKAQDDSIRAEVSDLKSAINRFNNTLTISLKTNGLRTYTLEETGMVVGGIYYLRLTSYTGNYLTRVTARFLDSNDESLGNIGDYMTVGTVIKFKVPATAVKLRFLFYTSTEESSISRLTVNLWEYRFQPDLDDIISKQLNLGYIYSGSINVNRSTNQIEYTDLKILTTSGVFKNRGTGVVSFDSSMAVYVGIDLNNNTGLSAWQLGFVPFDGMVILFAYQNGKLYFTNQYDKITINGDKFVQPKNETICCLGDSFTAGSSGTAWWGYVNEHTGYNMVGLGVAGTRMTVTYTSGSTEYKCFIDRVADGALDSYSPDLIVVFGGINDAVKLHNSQCIIGEISDAAEYNASTTSGYSFIGRVKYLINLIKTKKPGVPILGVLPPDYSEGTSNYSWWYDYIGQIRNALQSVYEYYGIPYVNLKKDCQEMYIDNYNLATYRVNGLSDMHPSAAGHEAIGKIIYTKGIVDMFY